MLNRSEPQLFPPVHCDECEFSFPVSHFERNTLHCCVLYNTHVDGRQATCPKRFALSGSGLWAAWRKYAMPWITVFAETNGKLVKGMEVAVLKLTHPNYQGETDVKQRNDNDRTETRDKQDRDLPGMPETSGRTESLD